MSERRFRFGLVAASMGSVEDWTALAKKAENLGFDSIVSPDGTQLNNGFTALAAAAAVTEKIKLGNFVVSVPSYTPGMIAWLTSSLDTLSGGRFELGLGAGRPDGAKDAERVGMPWESGGRRVAQVEEVIDTVTRQFEEKTYTAQAKPRPKIMVAGAGDKGLTIAARKADIVAIASTMADFVAERAVFVRQQAGDRFDDIELSTNVFHIGDGEMPPFVKQFGIDPEKSKYNANTAVLNGDEKTAIDVLKKRRDEWAVSYVTINSMAIDKAAPIVDALTGN